MLAELNWAVGKGPRPEWMEGEDEDEQRLLGHEGGARPESYIDAEVISESHQLPAGPSGDAPDAGSGAADPE
jgi:hypothetical protein